MVLNKDQIKSRNQRTLEKQSPTWCRNLRLNASYINEQVTKRPIDLENFIPGNKDLSKVVIVASGPSLYEYRDRLLSLNKYFVLASLTNLSFCLAHGLVPDAVVACDSHSDHLKDVSLLRSNRDITLLCPPIVHPGIIDFFHPHVYFYKAFLQNEKGNFHNPYNHFMNLLYDIIPSYVAQAGSVTNQAVLLMAKYWQTKLWPITHIFLIGADYAAGKTLDRVPFYSEVETEQGPVFQEEPNMRPSIKERPHIEHQGQITSDSMFFYKISLMVMWKSMRLPLWRIGNHGILSEIPHISIRALDRGRFPDMYPEKIMDKNLHKFWTGPSPFPDPDPAPKKETETAASPEVSDEAN